MMASTRQPFLIEPSKDCSDFLLTSLCFKFRFPISQFTQIFLKNNWPILYRGDVESYYLLIASFFRIKLSGFVGGGPLRAASVSFLRI